MSKSIIGQDRALFSEFIEFCDKEPKEKLINHSSWKSCAVGQFLISKGVEIRSNTTSYNCPEIILLLGNPSSGLFNRVDTKFCSDNYGDFTEFLKSHLPTINEVV